MKTQFLSKWRTRDLESVLASMARYTRFVFFSKFFLLFLGLVMLAAIIIVPLLQPADSGMRIVFSNVQKTALPKAPAEPPKMVHPRYQGTDSENQPYTVTADSAEQINVRSVKLNNLTADITLKNATWLSVAAKSGTLDTESRTLDLAGAVHLFYDAGYEATTEQVHMDLRDGTAQVTVPIAAQGPFGNFKASGAIFDRKSNVATFSGPVYLTLYPGAK